MQVRDAPESGKLIGRAITLQVMNFRLQMLTNLISTRKYQGSDSLVSGLSVLLMIVMKPTEIATAKPAPQQDRAARSGGGRKPSASVKLGRLSGLLGYHLRRAEVFAFQNFAHHLSEHGISPGQLGVLLLVEANPGTNQTRIGKAIGIDRSTLVTIIDALEKRGLIRREPSPTDRRSHALFLSDAAAATGQVSGAAFLDQIRPRLEAHEAEIARNLTTAEQVQLKDLLSRIATP